MSLTGRMNLVKGNDGHMLWVVKHKSNLENVWKRLTSTFAKTNGIFVSYYAERVKSSLSGYYTFDDLLEAMSENIKTRKELVSLVEEVEIRPLYVIIEARSKQVETEKFEEILKLARKCDVHVVMITDNVNQDHRVYKLFEKPKAS